MSKAPPKRPSTSVRVDSATHQALVLIANDFNMTIIDIINDMMLEYSKNKYNRTVEAVPIHELLKIIGKYQKINHPEPPLPDWLS